MLPLPSLLVEGNPELSDWNILHAFRGSFAHGTRLDPDDPFFIDDIDTIGICVPPPEYYIGLKKFFSQGTREIKYEEWDIVIYEAKKAITLLAGGNPNIISLLWMEDDKYFRLTSAGKIILENRHLFSTKKAHAAFVGYAYGQLRRMKHFAFQGYMGAKRKAIVEKLSYDSKNASHAIRIFRMGIEMMREGRVYVERPDAEELMAIKRGEWTLEEIVAEAERLKLQADEAYEKSNLPLDVDWERINNLAQEVIRTAWRENGVSI